MEQRKLNEFNELETVALGLEKLRPKEVKPMAHGEVRNVFNTSINVNNTQDLKESALASAKVYANATDSLLTQLRILGAKQKEVKKMESLTMSEILREKDINGKPKFSNVEMRKTELVNRVDKDFNALRSKDELYDIEMEIKEAEELRNVAKTLLKSIELISAL